MKPDQPNPSDPFSRETIPPELVEWARQTFDGRMAYSAVTTDTVATLLGRPPIKLEAWARQHRSDLGT